MFLIQNSDKIIRRSNFFNKKSERPLKLRVAGLQYNGIYSQSYQDIRTKR